MSLKTLNLEAETAIFVGALLVGTRFWVTFYYNYDKEPPK